MDKHSKFSHELIAGLVFGRCYETSPRILLGFEKKPDPFQS